MLGVGRDGLAFGTLPCSLGVAAQDRHESALSQIITRDATHDPMMMHDDF
jgi:hypothetical protein